MNIGSPGKVYLLTFMLTVLGSFFIGIFMITVNICFRRGVGTVLAYLMVGVQTMSGIPIFIIKSENCRLTLRFKFIQKKTDCCGSIAIFATVGWEYE